MALKHAVVIRDESMSLMLRESRNHRCSAISNVTQVVGDQVCDPKAGCFNLPLARKKTQISPEQGFGS